MDKGYSNEELCNKLVAGLISKDRTALVHVLGQKDEAFKEDIINRMPVTHIRKLVIELSNLLSEEITVNYLQWLQLLLSLKSSVISSMADGRSILMPLATLLNDRSSPEYYMKIRSLQGKLMLLKQTKEVRRSDTAETVVTVQAEQDPAIAMEIDSESDTESEDELDGEQNEEESTNDEQTEEAEEDCIGEQSDEDSE